MKLIQISTDLKHLHGDRYLKIIIIRSFNTIYIQIIIYSNLLLRILFNFLKISMSQEDYNAWAIQGIFQSTYSNGIYILTIFGITYAGVFIILNNNYVFKPKLQKLIEKYRPSNENQVYKISCEVVIDIIKNLLIITFAFSSAFVTSSHNAITTFVISDGIWMAVYASIIFYHNKNVAENLQFSSPKLLLKNVGFLLLIYLTIVVHYALQIFFISLPLLLLAIYLGNLISNHFFDRIINYLQKLFFEQQQEQEISLNHLNEKSLYPQPLFLAKNFPVTEDQYLQRSKKVTETRNKMKLKSKALIYERFHQIYFKILISHEKYKLNEKNKFLTYCSKLNGSYTSNIKYDVKQTINPSKKEESVPTIIQQTSNNFNSTQVEYQQQQLSGYIHYVFPIRIFQFSPIISVVFTIGLNLAYGFLIDYAIQILLKLKIGYSIAYIPAFFILPFTTKAKINEFYMTQIESSLFRYGILGFALLINLMSYNSMQISQSVLNTLYLNASVQIVFTIFCISIALLVKSSQYKYIMLGFIITFALQNFLFYLNSASYY